MASKVKQVFKPEAVPKRTSIGHSHLSRPKNKRNTVKRYRGQGRP